MPPPPRGSNTCFSPIPDDVVDRDDSGAHTGRRAYGGGLQGRFPIGEWRRRSGNLAMSDSAAYDEWDLGLGLDSMRIGRSNEVGGRDEATETSEDDRGVPEAPTKRKEATGWCETATPSRPDHRVASPRREGTPDTAGSKKDERICPYEVMLRQVSSENLSLRYEYEDVKRLLSTKSMIAGMLLQVLCREDSGYKMTKMQQIVNEFLKGSEDPEFTYRISVLHEKPPLSWQGDLCRNDVMIDDPSYLDSTKYKHASMEKLLTDPEKGVQQLKEEEAERGIHHHQPCNSPDKNLRRTCECNNNTLMVSCSCFKLALETQQTLDDTLKLLESTRKKFEDSYRVAQAYRNAFEEKLFENRCLRMEFAKKNFVGTKLPDVILDGINRCRKITDADKWSFLSNIVDLISDKTEEISYLRLHCKILANKIQIQEEELKKYQHEVSKGTRSLGST